MPLLSSRAAHLCNDGPDGPPPPWLQCSGRLLGRRSVSTRGAGGPFVSPKSLKSCRSLFFSPLLRPFHSTPVATERELSSSNPPHHLLPLLALHRPLTLLSSERLVQLISVSMDSLLWPRRELSSSCCLEGRRAEVARLVGFQTFLFFFPPFSSFVFFSPNLCAESA